MLSIGELAKRSDVTTRTLRYYESKGLLCPARSEAGQRLYKYPDVLRLQQIQLLKRTGLTLEQIKIVLESATIDARAMLELQRDMLENQLSDTPQALSAVKDTLEQLQGSETDLFTLCNMIKMGESAMSEEKWKKVWSKF